jgi:hypothetical protein
MLGLQRCWFVRIPTHWVCLGLAAGFVWLPRGWVRLGLLTLGSPDETRAPAAGQPSQPRRPLRGGAMLYPFKRVSPPITLFPGARESRGRLCCCA